MNWSHWENAILSSPNAQENSSWSGRSGDACQKPIACISASISPSLAAMFEERCDDVMSVVPWGPPSGLEVSRPASFRILRDKPRPRLAGSAASRSQGMAFLARAKRWVAILEIGSGSVCEDMTLKPVAASSSRYCLLSK